ncbi:hypothetical protein SteCoe_18115 [Stentor coeruleus]|uniref:EF-hand domain-containing protein n=1 Tax=Stentor coeruleus TaxID=5963 RepID=A0A1R2BXT3_9CILI|nr:hypothetical protein SteCoe_18115 [Stentor coeruleus]
MSFPQMYDLFRKLEQKSPLSANKDDETSRDEEYTFEKVNTQGKSLRPVSAKGMEYFKQKRPTTSKHPPINIRRDKTKHLVDYSILSRLKPRRIKIDKERLYEDNMALKLKNNSLHEEIIRLRTKISQVEKELNRREDQIDHNQNLKPVHLVNSLKSAIKDLKNEISIKNDEIIKLKRNIRSTKLNEIELEVQAYIDECTRLRHHLEEIMRQRDTPQLTQVPEERTTQSSFLVNNLKKENEDLNTALKVGNEEITKWKERVNELEKFKKNNSVKKNELTGAKSEIQKLKIQIDNLTKDFGVKENSYKEEIVKLKKNYQDIQGKTIGYEAKIKELMFNIDEQGRQVKYWQDMCSKYNEEETIKAEKERFDRIRKEQEEKRIIEEKEKVERQRKEQEEKLRIEKKKQEDEEKNRLEKAQEIKKDEEEAKRKDEEARKIAEAKKKEEEAKRKEEEAKRKEEEAKKKEEAKKVEDELLKQAKRPKEESHKAKPSDEEKSKKLAHESSDPEKSKDDSKEKPKKKPKSKKSKDQSKSPLKIEPTSPEIKSILDHFAFRMQINRIPKTKLFQTLFGNLTQEKPLSKTEMSSYLKKAPFSFNPSDIETLNNFLLESPKATARSIEAKLFKSTNDWEVFSPEDEEKFDENIGQIIGSNKDKLNEICKEYDLDGSGIVSLENFRKALKKASIEIPGKIFSYMTLLFYSHDMKLAQVPYKHFIQAYGNPEGQEEEDEISDEEKAKVVRHYLGIIAQILIQNKRGIFDIFECDENGIISPDEFYAGLKRIGLGEMDQDHIMLMLEALQFEESQEVCVHIEELEEILVHYGVSPSNEGDENLNDNEEYEEEDTENSPGHYKKVSLLESENLELSEDSPVKEKKKDKEIKEPVFSKHKSFDRGGHKESEEYDSDYDDDDFQ